MSSDSPSNTSEPKDGFDLMEYPCDYLFKAMCRVDKLAAQSAEQVIQEIVLKHVAASRIVSVYTHQSRTGKFESVSLNVQLFDRAELETIYQAIAESPLVVMTL